MEGWRDGGRDGGWNGVKLNKAQGSRWTKGEQEGEFLVTLVSCPLQKVQVAPLGSIGTSESVPSTAVLSSPLQQLQMPLQGTRFTKIIFFHVQLLDLKRDVSSGDKWGTNQGKQDLFEVC
jgi:hypothetical protein